MKKVLVTGAAGFIGSHTVEGLLRAGHHVMGLDNFRTGSAANLQPALQDGGFELVEGDATDESLVKRLLESFGAQSVLHLAALVSVPESIAKPGDNYRLNVALSHSVFAACAGTGVKRVAFASSAAVYGEGDGLPLEETGPVRPISPYGAAKLASEALLHGYGRTFGFSTVALRYFNAFGPRQAPDSAYSGVISIFANKMAQGLPAVIYGDGGQARDFVAVGDVARANLLAATCEGAMHESVNICTGRAVLLRDLAAELGKLHPHSPAPRYEPARTGDIRISCGAPARALEMLGFQTEISLARGLADLVRANGGSRIVS